MSGLRIFATATPTQRGMAGAPIHPMTGEQRRFWQLFRERKAKEKRDAQG